MIELADGVSTADGKAAVQQVADTYFAPDVQTRQEYVDSVAGQIDQFLTIVYVLLILAIVIALDGHREHAVAVGARADARARSAAGGRPVAASAAVDGALGVGDHRGVRHGRRRARRAVPRLGAARGDLRLAEHARAVHGAGRRRCSIVLVLGAIVGVLAGWRPARRAAKLDILEAVASE